MSVSTGRTSTTCEIPPLRFLLHIRLQEPPVERTLLHIMRKEGEIDGKGNTTVCSLDSDQTPHEQERN